MEYENYVSAIAFIDAAIKAISGYGDTAIPHTLTEIRNDLNGHRIALLGNGFERPFEVEGLLLPPAPHTEEKD